MDTEHKQQAVKTFQTHPKDTGSTDVQVALISGRIQDLTGHLKVHKKHPSSRRGLLQLVGQRRRLLVYLAKNEPTRYTTLISRLGLRR